MPSKDTDVAQPLVAEKAGYLTTEFWLSVLTVAAILFKLLGVDLTASDAQDLAVQLAGLAGGFVAVWGIVSRYIKGRSEVKAAALQAEGVKALARAGQPVTLNYGGKR